MIAGSGAGAVFHAAPGFVVALEVLFGAVGISEVACGENGSGDFLKELGGGFGSGEVFAVGNVASADKDGSVSSGGLGSMGSTLHLDTRAKSKESQSQENRTKLPVNPLWLRTSHNYPLPLFFASADYKGLL
jgi:hypothetical protein